MSTTLRRSPGPLRGTVRVPGDKSISHRIALLAPLASGPCRARGWREAAGTISTLEAVRALGAGIELRDGVLRIEAGDFPGVLRRGDPPVGPAGPVAIDCGNSGTTARLLLGLLAGRRIRALLDGDSSLRRRPAPFGGFSGTP